jgi:DNA-binding XRE family transcriptional regulator
MPDLGQAYVQIIPSAEGISSKITGVLNGPSEAAGQEAGEKYSGGFGSKIAGGFKAAALGFAGFAAAGGAALGKSIADTATLGDHIDKMSQKIGWSAEAYQKWDYVLQRAGTSVDSMAPVMKKLSSEAVNNSEAFQQLGISQEEVANMSQEELSELSGISRTTLSKIENNEEVNVNTRTIAKLAEVFNVKPSEIFLL